MVDDMWAYFAIALTSFWIGIGNKRVLESRLLRERRIWDPSDLGGLELATEEEIAAAKRLDLGRAA